MNPFENRPTEVANLLNPAFCGEILLRAIAQYRTTSGQAFPYALAFLVLPIVLHKRTRESIPLRTRQQLHAWLQEHQEVRVGFAERAKEMVPFTSETVMFLLQLNQLAVSDRGELLIRRRSGARRVQTTAEIEDCYKKALLVGRWFARSGAVENVFAMWGVKP